MEQIAKNKKSWSRIVLLTIGVIFALLILIYLIVSTIWRYSGSNTWELMREENNVKVYSLKAPGSDLLQVRGVVNIRSTLAGLIEFMQDPTVCDRIGCYESRMIEYVDERLQYYTFRYDYPLGFNTREFVVKLQAHQYPNSGEVILEFTAAPEKLPQDDCCVRITDLKNSWIFKPVGNGEVEVQYTMNMQEGGFLPSFLLNKVRPKVMTTLLPRLEDMVSDERYQNAQFDFIAE